MSQAGIFSIALLPPGTVVETLQGNSGGPVGPTAGNNIFVVGDGTTIDVVGNPGTHSLTISSIGAIQEFFTDDGFVVVPIDGAVTVHGVNNIYTTAATAHEIGISVAGTTQYDVQVGSAAGALFSIPNGTTGQVLTANTGDNPSWETTDYAGSFPTDNGTAIPLLGVLNIKANTSTRNDGATVSFGGSGNTVLLNVTDLNNNTTIGLDSGGTAMTGSNNTALGEGCAIALTSGSANTIIGEGAGTTLTTGFNNILLGYQAGDLLAVGDNTNTLIGHPGLSGVSNLVIVTAGAGGTPVLHNYPGQDATTTNGGNIFIGNNAGNFTLNGGAGTASNDGVGDGALSGLTTGARNDAMGAFALFKLTTGSDNVGIGGGVGFNSGSDTGLVSGNYNTLIGYTAGDSFTSSESSNIVINNVGVVGDNNTIRIGTNGSGDDEQSSCYIAGIAGVNVGSTANVVTEVGNQLGTAVITAGVGITVTPTANTITISSSGAVDLNYTNVATSPYVVVSTDDYLSVNTTSAPITIELPNAATLGRTFVIKDRTGTAGTNYITISSVSGSVNIDGITSYIIDTAYQSVNIMGNGTSYEIY